MAYGSGYAGGYVDTVADRTTLEGAATFAVSQSAALVAQLALSGQTDWVMAQSAGFSANPLALAGASSLALSQTSALEIVGHDVNLAGTAAITITQAGAIRVNMGIGGSASFPISVPDVDLEMLELILLGAVAQVALQASGTLFVIRPATPPPTKIVGSLVKRRSILMPYPSISGTTGRPT